MVVNASDDCDSSFDPSATTAPRGSLVHMCRSYRRRVAVTISTIGAVRPRSDYYSQPSPAAIDKPIFRLESAVRPALLSEEKHLVTYKSTVRGRP